MTHIDLSKVRIKIGDHVIAHCTKVDFDVKITEMMSEYDLIRSAWVAC